MGKTNWGGMDTGGEVTGQGAQGLGGQAKNVTEGIKNR